MRETIFALSSGGLPSGVAVVRMSGPGTASALEDLAGDLPAPRHATLKTLRDGDGVILDKSLILFFPGPHSFTGEDCGELHLHGGRAVVGAILETLSHRKNFRLAEAGEFTRRAFLNGKFNLTEAEALSDLISAETETQRRFALSNSESRHKDLYGQWRRTLIQTRAMIEAELDFSDEEDVPGSVAEQVWQEVEGLRDSLKRHAAGYRTAEIIREGFRVVILGAPNAGKSSLLNTLARREIAIVTDEPGTTRDVLEANLDINGIKVIVTDTAGIRENPGKVEALGIDRAISRAREADLLLLMEDCSDPVPVDIPYETRSLKVGNKLDLAGSSPDDGRYDFAISARTGEGIDSLLQKVHSLATAATVGATETLPFRERHVQLLLQAANHVESAVAAVDSPLELRAEELRLAADSLGRITGTIDVEDLLDTIFSQFCIGK
ncbi:tRNA uridine-5-carboxymethylaminomethyl(34) synthesis GTPase MnmE [Nitratireductor kimnyeongensis]|uniref:tRNA modification GTPase MnmE n=1 Tax=Nitratireductor kimnyeongensis TaxID=430679 RepID=A0ABW0TBN8_9HYPH|nr:tRNA uridine-5-carboxymethylaminomethyl(34) synthesis GTPase MnmE [Nitratireductor kimnyeongensis]QZZ37070.1 tRNA uridine-5-carboxymethylaminomethyl(34) synthesis GTPase MnmE [Nitratireductor kimnyeongensis]